MLRLPGSVCEPGEATDNLLWSGVHAVLCDWQGAEGTGELSEEVGGGGVFGFWGMICALYVCMYVCTTPYVCTWTKRICVCMYTAPEQMACDGYLPMPGPLASVAVDATHTPLGSLN